MTSAGATGDERPACSAEGCEDAATVFIFQAREEAWRPLCTRHVERFHPSLEVHAWQAAGLLKPVELGRPKGPPTEPDSDRGRQFKREVFTAMGWQG